MIAFTYPGRLPGMNEMIAAAKIRGGPNAYPAIKRRYTGQVAMAIMSASSPLNPLYRKVWLSIDWYEPNSKRDPDNIMAGQKFILDALVHRRIIGNDDQAHVISITHRFHVDAKDPRVVVEVYER